MKFPSEIRISDTLGQEFSFNTFEAFESFIKSQANFWSQRQSVSSQSAIASTYIQKCSGFQVITNQINAWKPDIGTWDTSVFNNNLTNLINGQIGNSWIWSNHPFVEKWSDLLNESVNTADAFFEAIVHKTTQRFSNGLDFFQGYVIAYEYINQNNTEINKRRDSEKKSLSKLSSQLTVKHDELIDKVDEFETDLTAWKDKIQTDFSKWHDKQKVFFDETILAHSKNVLGQLSAWTDKKQTLENLYQEKLRFDSPASYWQIKSQIHRDEGYGWVFALIGAIVVGVTLFGWFFITWLHGDKNALSLNSIEGIIIYATILSTYAFLIKSLSKLTFSAFHLQRDAEEREQLTHLYLALKEGAEDDVESRRIILQALFSRSDTGLLAGDHSPTMPSVQDVIKITRT